ncbi:MAG: hypothetical protein JNK30_06250 [Phenylobacterium sp.]|uniref:beta-1,4-glucuronosyltransferase WelK n=1 Tax=Phenylobacterium sp. TaxID=1871053 RepID=UPI001A436688|nr:glycosyltransferase [Phenylobacterium sp.]MBL8770967.1 hypothetical protein [Phenylobacterium sp.]
MAAGQTADSEPQNPTRDRAGLRVCLAASGGGHVRQLLDLEPVWSRFDHFFVTEDTALGRTLSERHRTHFLPHFAWGQAKLGAPFRMLAGAARSLARSVGIMLRERPDVIISTGAGAVYFPVLLGRLLGAHVVVIESFARFEQPSLFGRLASPLAHDLVVQSAKLAPYYPRAKVFDPFRVLPPAQRDKQPWLFATVGATLPFDRLVATVATAAEKGLVPERITVQTGIGGLKPEGLETHETLSFDRVQEILGDCSIVVCHGGTGSLITALRQGCQVIAIPRLSRLGEHYDDHQSEITSAFEARGLVQVANTQEEFEQALERARTRTATPATTDPRELIAFLDEVLASLRGRAARSAAR